MIKTGFRDRRSTLLATVPKKVCVMPFSWAPIDNMQDDNLGIEFFCKVHGIAKSMGGIF
jgi:hypothetical protein